MRRSDVTVVTYDLYVVGQHGVLREVKWWRFIALLPATLRAAQAAGI